MRSWLPPPARCAAILVVAIGAYGLLGWVLDSRAMREFASNGIQIKTNTAIAILLSGLSLWLLAGTRSSRWTRWAAGGAAALVLLIGGLTLAEHLTGWDFGIDQLLFRELPGEPGTASPNRVGPPASTGFVLAGSCLLLLLLRSRSTLLYQSLAVAVGLIASLSILGYAFGTTALYGLPKYTGIALHTSLALTALAAGLLLARPNQGIAAIVFDPGIGGAVARRLLPPAILLPFVLGWLRIQGERSQVYDAAFGTAIVMLLLIATYSVFVLVHAEALGRADRYRRHAEEAVLKSRAKLEAALASMTDAVFISDAEGRFIDFNDAFATFHRFKNKEDCLRTLAEYPDIMDVFMADGRWRPWINGRFPGHSGVRLSPMSSMPCGGKTRAKPGWEVTVSLLFATKTARSSGPWWWERHYRTQAP